MRRIVHTGCSERLRSKFEGGCGAREDKGEIYNKDRVKWHFASCLLLVQRYLLPFPSFFIPYFSFHLLSSPLNHRKVFANLIISEPGRS